VTRGHPVVEWSRTPGGSPYGAQFWVSHPSTAPGLFFANLADTSGGWRPIFSGPNIISTGVFQHIAVTYDKLSGQGRLFLNGLIVTQVNLGSFTAQTSYDLYLACGPG